MGGGGAREARPCEGQSWRQARPRPAHQVATYLRPALGLGVGNRPSGRKEAAAVLPCGPGTGSGSALQQLETGRCLTQACHPGPRQVPDWVRGRGAWGGSREGPGREQGGGDGGEWEAPGSRSDTLGCCLEGGFRAGHSDPEPPSSPVMALAANERIRL